jgi:predicted permease
MRYIDIFKEILLLFAYMLTGYLCAKLKFVKEVGIKDISRIIVNVSMPALVIMSMNIPYDSTYLIGMAWVFVIGLAYLSFATVIGSAVTKRLICEVPTRQAIRYCMLFGNCIFLGYPMSKAFLGELGVLYASVYVGLQTVFQWTIGVSIYRKCGTRRIEWKKLINTGTVSIIIGLSMFFLRIEVPPLMSRFLSTFGGISTPLALFVIGATLEGVKPRELLRAHYSFLTVLFKLVLLPLSLLAILLVLPIDPSVQLVLMIMATAPCQASGIVFAFNFGGDAENASKSIALSSLLCLFTIPLILLFTQS